MKSQLKNIWIIDHYSSEPCYGGIIRQYDFANEISKRGYNVTIIASSFSHFTHTYISEEDMFVSKISDKVHYVYLHTTSYEKNGGIERFRNMYSFYRAVVRHFDQITKEFGPPDAVEGCSVHPLAWVAAYKTAKKYNIRFSVEVRDLWPKIWVAGGEKSKYHPVVLFFGWLEKWVYNKADKIIYSMQYGDRYICEELGFSRDKVELIGQPMNCQRFDDNAIKNYALLPQEIREFMGDDFCCVFAGYFMIYEGVYVMLEAAKILQEKGLPIKMVFVGSGQELEQMKQFVLKNGLVNVYIGNRIGKDLIPSLLSKCQICLAHLAIPNHEKAYKYGVSKNKVNEYLYSGNCTLYGFLYKDDPVQTSGGGYVYEPFNSLELSKCIEHVYKMDDKDRQQFGINGRSYIVANHSVEILADKLLKVLFD